MDLNAFAFCGGGGVMEAHDTVQMVLSVGRKYNMDIVALELLPLKVIALSVKFVSREKLWAQSFGESAFVHWELLKLVPPTKNVLGGCAEWLGMLSFCQWEELSKVEHDIASSHPPLAVLRRNLRESNLDTGGADAWTMACRVFVLTLVQGLPCLTALEMLTCAYFKRNTRGGCMEFMAKQVRLSFSLLVWMRACVCGESCARMCVCRRRACSRQSSTRRHWAWCWSGARRTRGGWSRSWRCRRRRRRTRSWGSCSRG
jgi:hypothetical protein